MRGIEIKSTHTGVPGWHTEEEENALIELVHSLSFPPNELVVIVELGGEYGRSASEFAYALKAKNYDGHVWTVDNFTDTHPIVGNLLDAYQHNLTECGLIKYVTPLKGDTIQQAHHWKNRIDLLFIDAGHSYLAVKSDIAAWVGYVKKGGIVAFHDYAKSTKDHPTHLDVKKAVDEWFNRVRSEWQRVEGPDSLVWFIRNSPVGHEDSQELILAQQRDMQRTDNVIKARLVDENPTKAVLRATLGEPEKIEGPEDPPYGKVDPVGIIQKPDYDAMTYKQLRELAQSRGITERKKNAIIQALIEWDSQ